MLNTRTARRFLLDDDNHEAICGNMANVAHECLVKEIISSTQKETLEYLAAMFAMIPWKHRDDGAVLVYLDDIDVVLERALDVVRQKGLGK
jgi:hypothetical protein